MIWNEIIKGEDIYLRAVEVEDCNEKYLGWLNDREVNRYLETRWLEQSIDKIKEFVTSIRNSDHSYLFAIIYNENHVGNIKIGPIHRIYKYSDISYFVGDKSCWGKGVATQAIKLVTEFGFVHLSLNRIQAGLFENNIGSEKALIKNGFKREAVFRKQIFLTNENEYCDHIYYAVLKSEWNKKHEYNKK